MKHKLLNARSAAAKTIDSVLTERRSLTDVLQQPDFSIAPQQQGLLRELSAGTLRWYWPLASVANALLHQPLKQRDHDVWCLLLVGLYQIHWLNMPQHVAVNETVNACDELAMTGGKQKSNQQYKVQGKPKLKLRGKPLGKKWARGLINALLREAIRRRGELFSFGDEAEVKYAHPNWMIDILKSDWPERWTDIIDAGNQRPGMSLRVNVRKQNRDAYLHRLHSADINAQICTISPQGLHVSPPLPSHQLPGFDEGDVSIQDHGAQLVAQLVNPKPGERILDACAAPGGKACHLLECEPRSSLTLVDISAARLKRTHSEMQRLGMSAEIKCADVLSDDQWYNGELYDCIVIDAPCSGSGVIGRHPDIKHLRQAKDIVQNQALQQRLLDSLWPKLATNGRLVYVTCSVYQQENADAITEFCHRTREATITPMDAIKAYTQPAPGGVGRQRLPVARQGDGFYFAVLSRR